MNAALTRAQEGLRERRRVAAAAPGENLARRIVATRSTRRPRTPFPLPSSGASDDDGLAAALVYEAWRAVEPLQRQGRLGRVSHLGRSIIAPPSLERHAQRFAARTTTVADWIVSPASGCRQASHSPAKASGRPVGAVN